MTGDTTTFDVVHQFLPGVRTHSFLLAILDSEHPICDSDSFVAPRFSDVRETRIRFEPTSVSETALFRPVDRPSVFYRLEHPDVPQF